MPPAVLMRLYFWLVSPACNSDRRCNTSPTTKIAAAIPSTTLFGAGLQGDELTWLISNKLYSTFNLLNFYVKIDRKVGESHLHYLRLMMYRVIRVLKNGRNISAEMKE